jgi:hypothetical protein
VSVDGLSPLLERLAAAATDDEMWSVLGEIPPPEREVERVRVRERLVVILRKKGVHAPARVVDALGYTRARVPPPDKPDDRTKPQNSSNGGRFVVRRSSGLSGEVPDEPPDLAHEANILDELSADLVLAGLAGERDGARLLYLMLTSRLLPWGSPGNRPVSGLARGAASTGKSFLTELVLEFFPPSAHFLLSAASKRFLFYTEEPLEHRFIVIAEWASIANDEELVAALRTLLTEGRLRYGTVMADGAAPRALTVGKDGPTGLLMTTTRPYTDDELETRLIAFPTDDSREQTRAVYLALAAREKRPEPLDASRWHELQEWLAQRGEHRVQIPYFDKLAAEMPDEALRLRRDFVSLLCLVRAHALLHQVTRARADDGEVVATLDDYAAVRELLDGLISQSVDAAVSAQTRATVEAVRALTAPEAIEHVSARKVTDELGIGRSATYARIRRALNAGYLVDLSRKDERGMKLAIGVELPVERRFLPAVEALR